MRNGSKVALTLLICVLCGFLWTWVGTVGQLGFAFAAFLFIWPLKGKGWEAK